MWKYCNELPECASKALFKVKNVKKLESDTVVQNGLNLRPSMKYVSRDNTVRYRTRTWLKFWFKRFIVPYYKDCWGEEKVHYLGKQTHEGCVNWIDTSVSLSLAHQQYSEMTFQNTNYDWLKWCTKFGESSCPTIRYRRDKSWDSWGTDWMTDLKNKAKESTTKKPTTQSTPVTKKPTTQRPATKNESGNHNYCRSTTSSEVPFCVRKGFKCTVFWSR